MTSEAGLLQAGGGGDVVGPGAGRRRRDDLLVDDGLGRPLVGGFVEDAIAAGGELGDLAHHVLLVLEVLAYHKENHFTDQKVNDMVLAAIELSWQAIRAHKEHMRMVFEAILRDGIESGEFEALDPRETSRLLMVSLVHFCHPVLVAQYLQDQADIETDARATVHFLLRALTPRS